MSSGLDDSQLGSEVEEGEGGAAQWVDEDELDGMDDSEEDEFAEGNDETSNVSNPNRL